MRASVILNDKYNTILLNILLEFVFNFENMLNDELKPSVFRNTDGNELFEEIKTFFTLHVLRCMIRYHRKEHVR